MATARRGIVLRLSTEGTEQVKATLRSLGAEGEQALKQLERSTAAVTPGFAALDRTAKRFSQSISGEFQRLSSNLVQMVSPVNLITGAFGVLIGTAIGWFTQAISGTKETEEVTDRLAETVARLRDVYGEAARAQESMTEAERLDRLLRVQMDLAEAERSLASQRTQLERNLSTFMFPVRSDAWQNLGIAIGEFREELRTGEGDVEAFRARILGLATAADDTDFRELVRRIVDVTNGMADAETLTEDLAAAMRILEGDAAATDFALHGVASATREYADAMRALGNIAAPRLSDRDQAQAEFDRARAAAGDDTAAITAAYQALRDANRRIEAEEAAKAAEEAARARDTGGRAADGERQRLENLARSVLQEVNPALAAEAELQERLGDLAAIRAAQLIGEEDYVAAVADAHRDYAAAMDEARVAQLGLATDLRSGAIRALRTVAEEAMDAGQVMERALTTAFSAAQSAFDDFLGGGEDSFKKFVDALLKDLARLAFSQGLALLAKGILGALTGGLGGGGVIANAGVTTRAGVLHNGGRVGDPSPIRALDSRLFLGAPRLHSGLAADEFPAILQRGETVIPMGGTSGTVVQIINQGGGRVRQERSKMPDGRELVRIIIDAVAQNIADGGLVSRAIAQAAVDRTI
ncbi:MAG: phage tail tape measure C-terminal domain-containing protein [Geminicoccaceae bacterium]